MRHPRSAAEKPLLQVMALKRYNENKELHIKSVIIDHLLLDGSDLRFTSIEILRHVIFNNLTRFHALST